MNVPLGMPVTKGNWLLAIWTTAEGISSITPGSIAVSDDLGNAWTTDADALLVGHTSYAAFHSKVAASGVDSLTFTWSGGAVAYHTRVLILEIQGLDTMETPVVISTGSGIQSSATLNTTGPQRSPELVLGFSIFGDGLYPVWPNDRTNWTDVIALTPQPAQTAGALVSNAADFFISQYRIARWPGSFTMNAHTNTPGTWAALMFGFYNSQPSAFPQPLGNLFDDDSMIQCRMAARAGGLWGSIEMNSQRRASEWMTDFYWSMNAWPAWYGFRLVSIPRDEVSKVGNGAVYQAYTSSGPVANLSDDTGDFISDGKSAPITVKRKAESDAYNELQLQHINRNSNYEQVITSQPDPGSIALYGVRKKSPDIHSEVQDVAVARRLLMIAARRERIISGYQFTMNPRFGLLAPGALMTIDDKKAGIFAVPVRLLTVEEDEKFNLKATAEPYVYGMHSPDALPATAPTPNTTQNTATPASVNPPIIFEAVPRLSGDSATPELWIVVSDPDPNYGGSVVELSTDGGASYNPIGETIGNATTGVSTADWPAHADPDTADDLPLDLTESNGTLLSYSVLDEDEFTYPCYVQGGTTAIPYELMCYAVAQLTAAHKYTLKATGGNHLRRAVFDAPQANMGVDHPSGSRWAFLGPPEAPQYAGVLKVPLDPKWIGVTLHFKFLAYNQSMLGQQGLSEATDYTYTPTGTVGSANPNFSTYSVSGGALTQPSATDIHMAQATVTWLDGHQTIYSARDFTIPAPSAPTTYYVTIEDPKMLGDQPPGSTSCPAFCETTLEKVGAAGYVYIGSIQAIAGGGGTITGPGGVGGATPTFVVTVNGVQL